MEANNTELIRRKLAATVNLKCRNYSFQRTLISMRTPTQLFLLLSILIISWSLQVVTQLLVLCITFSFPTMSVSVRSVFTGIANLLALAFVVGVMSHGYFDEAKETTTSVALTNPVLQEAEIPVSPLQTQVRSLEQARSLRLMMMKKSSSLDCIPLESTSKSGKGKGMSRRELMMMKKKSSTEAPVRFPLLLVSSTRLILLAVILTPWFPLFPPECIDIFLFVGSLAFCGSIGSSNPFVRAFCIVGSYGFHNGSYSVSHQNEHDEWYDDEEEPLRDCHVGYMDDKEWRICLSDGVTNSISSISF